MARQGIDPQHSPQAAGAYNRILERVNRSVADLEIRTWEGVKEEIDRAVEAEAELGELTRDEVELLKAYVRRDVRELRQYVQETGNGVADWLQLDLALVEAKIRDILLSIADKTLVEHVELGQRLDHDSSTYMAGEIACAGMLSCLNCNHVVSLVETTRIEPCHECGNHYFRRTTAPFTQGAELDTRSP